MEDLSNFSMDMFVFVDESGRDALRKYGYSLRGQPAKSLKFVPTRITPLSNCSYVLWCACS